MPWDLLAAIDHAHMVLDWHANLPHKDIPPNWMWHVDHELELWFDDLKAEQERGSGGNDQDEEAPMMTNALARRRG